MRKVIDQLEQIQTLDSVENFSPFKQCDPKASSSTCDSAESCIAFSDQPQAAYCESKSCSSDADCVLGTCDSSGECSAVSYQELADQSNRSQDLNKSLKNIQNF